LVPACAHFVGPFCGWLQAKSKKGKKGADGSGIGVVPLPPVGVLEAQTPLQLAKAVKNASELAGMVEAHLRDAAAMAQFFVWIEAELAAGCR
jgi:Xaa-Pro aminopeptidase